MPKAKTLTKEQKLFYVGLKKLDQFNQIRKKRELTYLESFEENKIKEVLFLQVRNFGISLAKSMTQKYRLPSDSYQELCQDLAAIFYAKYLNYNPLISTPTTYFVPYFRQVISEYLINNVHRLSQYDANNILKVRRAINYYEFKGIEWTEEMLTIRTSLSQKVIHSTLFYAYASNYAPIDEAFDLQSDIKSPEAAYVEKESQSTLMEAIQKNMNEEELELLLLRVNLDGKLLEQFSRPTLKKYKNTLSLQLNTSDAIEN